MTTMDNNRPTLSAEVSRFFESERVLGPISGNKRKISAATISPPSSRSSSDSAASVLASGQASASYGDSPTKEVDIPVSLRSVESYEFLGFTRARAEALWRLYLAPRLPGMEDDFDDFARWHIEHPTGEDPTSAQDDWDGYMRGLGINDELRTAVLLPEYDDVRYTASCKFWLLETIRIKWGVLKGLEDTLRMEQARIQRSRKDEQLKPRPKAAPPSQTSPSGRKPPTQQPLAVASSSSTRPAQVSDPPRQDVKGQPAPEVATAAAPPLPRDGHTFLWRGGWLDDHKRFYNEQTGAVKLDAIRSWPGDFSGITRLPYFTPQLETARRYGKYLMQRTHVANISIAQVAVPSPWIESLNVRYLWVGGQDQVWEKVIWYSRRGERLPKDLAYIKQTALLIGHVASGVHAKFTHMDSYEDIRQRDVMTVTVDGEECKALQWVFQTDEAQEEFENKCRGKVRLLGYGSAATEK